MVPSASALQANLLTVHERIGRACARAGRRPESVLLLAVSKTFPAAAVRAAADAGQRHFGENYVPEGSDKAAELAADGREPALVWHFIGPVQSNKTRPIAQGFQWVHTVEREKVAHRLSEQRDPSQPPLQVCLQVNVSGEGSKSGVAPQDVHALADAVASLPRLRLRGLMAIPEPTHDESVQRARFAQLRGLLESLRQRGHDMDTLSMGMSADLEAAILEGATIVQIGTAIFGERT